MKYFAAIALLAVGAMSYGIVRAAGQSAQQSGLWQLVMPSAGSGAGFAWKINTQTGDTYFCSTGADFTCNRLQDRGR